MTKFKTSIILGTIISLLLIIFVSCATEDIGLIEQQKQLPLNQNTDDTPEIQEIQAQQQEEQNDLTVETNLKELSRKSARNMIMIKNKIARNKLSYTQLQELQQLVSGAKTKTDLEIAMAKAGIKDNIIIADLIYKTVNLYKDFRANNPKFNSYSKTKKQNLLELEMHNAFENRNKLTQARLQAKTDPEKEAEARACEEDKKTCVLAAAGTYTICFGFAYTTYEVALGYEPELATAALGIALLACIANEVWDCVICEMDYDNCESRI